MINIPQTQPSPTPTSPPHIDIPVIESDHLARDRERLQRDEQERIDREQQEELARQRELARFD